MQKSTLRLCWFVMDIAHLTHANGNYAFAHSRSLSLFSLVASRCLSFWAAAALLRPSTNYVASSSWPRAKNGKGHDNVNWDAHAYQCLTDIHTYIRRNSSRDSCTIQCFALRYSAIIYHELSRHVLHECCGIHEYMPWGRGIFPVCVK